ncbi:hypothetical protein, partial [Clostridium perfringens]
KYEYNSENYKDVLELFKDCVRKIDAYNLCLESFYIGKVAFDSELIAEQWLRNANEESIKCLNNSSVPDGEGGWARPLLIRIAPGIIYRATCKEKFFVKVNWSHKENEMRIYISTDL